MLQHAYCNVKISLFSLLHIDLVLGRNIYWITGAWHSPTSTMLLFIITQNKSTFGHFWSTAI